MRKCDAIGCAENVPAGRFMCYPHWKLVPVPLQRTINTQFRGNRSLTSLMRNRTYVEACARAIEQVSGQPLPADNSYARLLKLLPPQTVEEPSNG